MIEDNKIDYSYKYCNRTPIDRLLTKTKYSEILIIKNGLITDTSIANIGFSTDGKIFFTPKTPLLKGTTRNYLLDKKIIFEKDITVKSIRNYKKIALFNAIIGFRVFEFILNNNIVILKMTG